MADNSVLIRQMNMIQNMYALKVYAARKGKWN